mmetsp:Transcript_40549/g.66621  ORF Transcript_40549/g.66621 Transcript_40549/m.66621 type:complete len:612 (-) Transcript_40549:1938-3773(-)
MKLRQINLSILSVRFDRVLHVANHVFNTTHVRQQTARLSQKLYEPLPQRHARSAKLTNGAQHNLLLRRVGHINHWQELLNVGSRDLLHGFASLDEGALDMRLNQFSAEREQLGVRQMNLVLAGVHNVHEPQLGRQSKLFLSLSQSHCLPRLLTLRHRRQRRVMSANLVIKLVNLIVAIVCSLQNLAIDNATKHARRQLKPRLVHQIPNNLVVLEQVANLLRLRHLVDHLLRIFAQRLRSNLRARHIVRHTQLRVNARLKQRHNLPQYKEQHQQPPLEENLKHPVRNELHLHLDARNWFSMAKTVLAQQRLQTSHIKHFIFLQSQLVTQPLHRVVVVFVAHGGVAHTRIVHNSALSTEFALPIKLLHILFIHDKVGFAASTTTASKLALFELLVYILLLPLHLVCTHQIRLSAFANEPRRHEQRNGQWILQQYCSQQVDKSKNEKHHQHHQKEWRWHNTNGTVQSIDTLNLQKLHLHCILLVQVVKTFGHQRNQQIEQNNGGKQHPVHIENIDKIEACLRHGTLQVHRRPFTQQRSPRSNGRQPHTIVLHRIARNKDQRHDDADPEHQQDHEKIRKIAQHIDDHVDKRTNIFTHCHDLKHAEPEEQHSKDPQ